MWDRTITTCNQQVICTWSLFYLDITSYIMFTRFFGKCIKSNGIFLFQVVGKSCKPIPVMILGVIFGRKRYPLLKYFFVFLIVIGVAMFMYKDKTPVAKTKEGEEQAKSGDFDIFSYIGIGELLLLLSLTCDGLTGAVQVCFYWYLTLHPQRSLPKSPGGNENYVVCKM